MSNRSSLVLASISLVLFLAVTIVVAKIELISTALIGERLLFISISNLSDAWKLPLFVVMQLGAITTSLIIGAVLIVGRQKKTAINLLMATSIAWLAAQLLKLLVARPRAEGLADFESSRHLIVDSFSYPSGHAAVAAAFAVVASNYLSTRWLLLVWPLAILAAFARIYFGAHFPLDVAGGFLLGLSIGLLISYFYRQQPGN